MSTCPPLPTVEQLLSEDYIEVGVNSLVAQEIVIRYIPEYPNGPYMDCVLILENEVEPGRIKMTNSWNVNNETGETTDNNSATFNKTYLIGHRFFKKNEERYNFDDFINEQEKFQIENPKIPFTTKDIVFDNLQKTIGNYLGPERKNVNGGTKRKATKRKATKRKTTKRKTTKRR
jgi:hypothetical protein